jgi:mono/diheme cytochrome c family protein
MRRGAPWSAIALSAVVILVATGCGNGTAGGADGIPPQDPALVAEGEVLYQATCAECHGSDLRGTDLGPSHLSKVYEPNHHADIAFLLAVQRGSPAHHWRFGDMAPVPGLTPEDVTAIVAFVRENQRVEGFEPYPP